MAKNRRVSVPKTTEEKKPKIVKVVPNIKLRLRADISTEAPIITVLESGTPLEVIEDTNDEWLKVKYEDSNGFVMKKFVE